jgi:hypothetical protein
LEKAVNGHEVKTMDQYITNAKSEGRRISQETGKSSKEGKDINWIYPDSLRNGYEKQFLNNFYLERPKK